MKKILGLTAGLCLALASACMPAMADDADGFLDVAVIQQDKVTDNAGLIKVGRLDDAELLGAIEEIGGESVRQTVESMAVYADSPVADWLLIKIVQLFGEYPWLGILLTLLAACVVVLGPIANLTPNPKDNAWLILLNKLAQLLTFGTAKNQPDVLTALEMVTNKPKHWPDLIRKKRWNYAV